MSLRTLPHRGRSQTRHLCVICGEHSTPVVLGLDADILERWQGRPCCFICAPKVYHPHITAKARARSEAERRAVETNAARRAGRQRHAEAAIADLGPLTVLRPLMSRQHIRVVMERRIMILRLAYQGQAAVQDLEAAVGVPLTRHMRVLREAGLIQRVRRDRFADVALTDKGRAAVKAIEAHQAALKEAAK